MTQGLRIERCTPIPALALCMLALSSCRAYCQAPVTADWKALVAPYAYDTRVKPGVAVEERHSNKEYTLHIEFAGPSGQKTFGVFERPRASGAYPVVLLLHGWTSSKDDMVSWIGQAIVDRGMAFLALDAPRHGERKDPSNRLDFLTMWKPITVEGIRDYRSAIRWLVDRKDVDAKHIGLFGYSMGAMMGAVLAGVDDRIKAAVLCVGGDLFRNAGVTLNDKNRDATVVISPSLYIGHISPRPLLMLNGKQDKTVTEAASTALYAAAREPKEQIMFDSGHILPTSALVQGVDWLAKRMAVK